MTNAAPTKAKGTKGSREAVDLFGATDEAAAEVQRYGALAGTLLRSTLRYAASHNIFCRASGRVLDLRTVVVVTASKGDDVSVMALSPEAWQDKVGPRVGSLFAEGVTVKVLTERHVRAALRASA